MIPGTRGRGARTEPRQAELNASGVDRARRATQPRARELLQSEVQTPVASVRVQRAAYRGGRRRRGGLIEVAVDAGELDLAGRGLQTEEDALQAIEGAQLAKGRRRLNGPLNRQVVLGRRLCTAPVGLFRLGLAAGLRPRGAGRQAQQRDPEGQQPG